jgi:hypothetical protein
MASQTAMLDAAAKHDEINVKAFDAETKRIQAVGAALTPEQVAAIAQQTIEQAMAQSGPTEDPQEVEAPVDQALTQALEGLGKGHEQTSGMLQEVVQAVGQLAQTQQQLSQGQQQNAQLMQTLIKLVQAPRIKELKFDRSGEPVG